MTWLQFFSKKLSYQEISCRTSYNSLERQTLTMDGFSNTSNMVCTVRDLTIITWPWIIYGAVKTVSNVGEPSLKTFSKPQTK